MANVMISPKVYEDLQEIRLQLSDEFDENVAQKAIFSIIKSIRTIAEFPNAGKDLKDVIGISTDYLYYIEKKNYIFYKYYNSTVFVERVLDFRRDYIRILLDTKGD